MIKSISIVLTQFFFISVNLKILRQPGYFIFKLNQQYFLHSGNAGNCCLWEVSI